MNRIRFVVPFILLMAWVTACAPRQIKPVASIDPAPLLETVNARRTMFDKGLSGTLDLAFKNGRQHFHSKAYIVAYPDGRFRLEVPGPFGGTLLVMASDNTEILAFYPGENRVFRSLINGRSINPHIPFPLPVDPAILPALIMGVFPEDADSTGVEAYLMDSGEKLLKIISGDNKLQFTYLFDKASKDRLREITVKGTDLEVSVRTRKNPAHLPRDFILHLAEGFLKGEWDSVAPFKGDGADIRLRIPDSVSITDLEASQ